MPETRALITGGCGFAGLHLYDLLTSEDWVVTLLDARKPDGVKIPNGRYREVDVRSKDALKKALEEFRPHVVYHLAGISYVPAAEQDKARALEVNLVGGLNLFEALRQSAPEARVVVISSSEVFGRVRPEDTPLNEESKVRPATFYAFTKAALESAAFHAASIGLKVVVLRPFNHIGPRQSEIFVSSAFARQVAEAESGKRPPMIQVGNLEAVRDFTDVDDMVHAYLLAGCRKLTHDLYNLCSGRGVKIRELLDILLDLSRIKIRVEVDPARMRPSDVPVLIGDNRRFSQETGWQPKFPLQDSLKRILEYWRGRST